MYVMGHVSIMHHAEKKCELQTSICVKIHLLTKRKVVVFQCHYHISIGRIVYY
jgi:hypothetical protein